MKILLTGATGFIGRHLYHWLKRRSYSVIVLHRPTSNVSIFPHSDLLCYEGDVETLTAAFKQYKIEGIVHLAACVDSHPITPAQQLRTMLESNIVFACEILHAAALAKVKWFLNTGTIWQNYNSLPYSDEYNPVNLYAASKQAFMTLARYYTETTPMGFATLKLSDTYGPGDTRRKVMQLFEENAISGTSLDMSPGYQKISLVHIDEVCRTYQTLIEKLNLGEVAQNTEYTLTAEHMPTLRELAAEYERTHSVHLNIHWGGRPYRPREVMNPYIGKSVIDCSKITRKITVGGG